jgi:transcriptional regulator with XRE-family HTH domain
MTANELVAYNLRRARELRGLTQEQAAERLEPYLGHRWSKATFSSAETAMPGRVRQFDADELLAFAAAFDLPLIWFFIPPTYTQAETFQARDGSTGITFVDVLDRIVPPAAPSGLAERFQELKRAGVEDATSEAGNRLVSMVGQRFAAGLMVELGDALAEAEHLRRTADLLERAVRRLGEPEEGRA